MPFLKQFLAGLTLSVVATLAGAVTVGDAAPDFDLPLASTLSGRDSRLLLSDLRGKVVYLDFWASWCAPCKQSFPWMNTLQERYGARGLEVVAVNVDALPEDARRFLVAVPARFRVPLDSRGGTPRSYAIKGMPTSFLIGADGKVLSVHSGFRAEESADLESRIAQALPAAR